MSTAIYDDAHAALNRLVGRRHNNPLGDAPFALIRRLAGGDAPPRVLDVGSGRGASSRWWAARGARVTALEPSAAMRDEARAAAREEGLEGSIAQVAGGIGDLPPGGRYDVILVHDVLCYLPDPFASLGTLLQSAAPRALLSVSDYHGREGCPEVRSLARAWGIRAPRTFEAFREGLDRLPATVLLHVDTTRQYRDHWRQVGASLDRLRDEALARVGEGPVRRFGEQVAAIGAAVATGEFGHQWTLLEALP